MNNATRFSLVLVIALAACAKSPSSIPATSIASSEYDHLTCQQMTSELATARTNLETASSKQNDMQTADAVGVFLVLIPPSALMGDSEADVAQFKGEVAALERASARKGC